MILGVWGVFYGVGVFFWSVAHSSGGAVIAAQIWRFERTKQQNSTAKLMRTKAADRKANFGRFSRQNHPLGGILA